LDFTASFIIFLGESSGLLTVCMITATSGHLEG
jgi:hypothetical protein